MLWALLLPCALAAPATFEDGPAMALSYEVAGSGSPGLQVAFEIPLLTSTARQGRVPGPPRWQLFAGTAASGRYRAGETLGAWLGGGLGLRHVGGLGIKQEVILGAGWRPEFALGDVAGAHKSTNWLSPRASVRIGRDDWIPYHSRGSWHVGPSVEVRMRPEQEPELTWGLDLGIGFRLKKPR